MSNLNITKLGEAAQADHELDYHERLGRNVVEADPWARPRGSRSPEILALGLVGGAGWAGMLAILTLARVVLGWGGCYSAECAAAAWLWWAWLASPAALLPVGLGVLAWSYAIRARAESARVAVTRDRYGNPVSAVDVLRQSPHERQAALRLAAETEVAVAPHRLYRGVDALTVNSAAAALTQAQQAASTLDIGPLPPERWAAVVDRQPHTMLAGKTDAGKSTMARYILSQRINANGQVLIIDPHWSPSNWWGLPGVGAGESWGDIADAFADVGAEYSRRLLEHAQGKATNEFQRLTVLVDEAIITKAWFDAQGKHNPWSRFAVVLGSGARKVRVSVILMTQSPNVQDLGLSGPLRENYSRIALDARTVRQLIEDDGSNERRKALLAGLPGQGDYPAAMEIGGEVFYLDRRHITNVERPGGADGALWLPSVPSVSAEAPQASPEASQRTDGRTDGATLPLDRLALLRALRRSGKSRDDARELMRAYGIEFENALWTEAGGTD